MEVVMSESSRIGVERPSTNGVGQADPSREHRETSDAETAEGAGRRSYGTIVVIGGGCYGSYYVRQLGRADAAGVLTWSQMVVVDRDPSCAVARGLAAGEVTTPRVHVEVNDWRTFFRGYLDAACEDAAGTAADAIVPSPLMPHLMFEWVLARAVSRWPKRVIAVKPLQTIPDMPWQRTGADGTHYVSFAEWVCPVNCVEPATCPKTRGPRWWTMPAAIDSYVAAARASGEHLAGPVIFHCTHRAYGVGMFDTATAVQADAVIRELPRETPAAVLVGTVSHCHGALSVVTVGAAQGASGGISS
jgi:hypothetical protein